MELAGSGYLQTLAVIAITFGAFAGLLVVFRQTIGGRLSELDLFFIRNTLLRSFMVAGFSMLPLLLALYELSPINIWRLSSVITAGALMLFTLITYVQRRSVSRTPFTKIFRVNAALQMLTALFLLVVADARILQPAAGHFSAAVSIVMITAIMGYLVQLRLILLQNSRRSPVARRG